MKINELLEAVVTPVDVVNETRKEFQALLKEAGVTAGHLSVRQEKVNGPTGKIPCTTIYCYVIPKIKNGEYDADEAEIALRLAHRLISKWLDQKEANGQPVEVLKYSSVGKGRKILITPFSFWAGSGYSTISSFTVDVSIANKADTRPDAEKEDRLNFNISGYNINPAVARKEIATFANNKIFTLPAFISKNFCIEGLVANIKEIRHVLINGDGDTPASLRKLYAFADNVLHTWGGYGKDDQLGFVVDDKGRVMYYNYHDNKGFLPISKIHDDDLMRMGNPIKTSLNKTRRGMIKIPYDDFVQMLKRYFPNAKV